MPPAGRAKKSGCEADLYQRGGGGGGLPDGGGGGGGEPAVDPRSLDETKFPDTGTLWPFAYMHCV